MAFLLAARYLRTGRRDSGNASTFLSVAGIAVGVMTLTVVLAVMNGFQLGFIESIVGISSYHLQLQPDRASTKERGNAANRGAAPLDPSVVVKIRAVPSVAAVVPFVERQALVEGVFQRPRACSIRAVPPDLFSLDPSQADMLSVREGSFDLRDGHSLVIGSELAAGMGTRIGDVLSLTSFASDAEGRLTPRRDTFQVRGIFHTGYYDFDSGLVFMSLLSADRSYGDGSELPRSWGIKIADRFDDARPLKAVSALVAGTGYSAQSWRTYNRSFFDALFMEKLMMMVLVGIIFIVVGFNVYHSLRRSVFERMEEIAVLKAVGIPPWRIQAIFVLEGLVIGLGGGVLGLAVGLALAVNVSGVFATVERVVNLLLRFGQAAVAPFAPGGDGGRFAIFSPAYFYLTRVPSHVFLRETFLVACFAVTACVAAAWAASRAVSGFRPSEVLRYE
jgi:lipoprotein-releasing system permease protein